MAGQSPDLTTAGGRWGNQMAMLFQSQFRFAELRLKMENSVNILTSLAILGPAGLQKTFERLGKTAPTAPELYQAGVDLVDALIGIQNQSVVGEPSEHNNLDTYVAADKIRLGELITNLGSFLKPGTSVEGTLQIAEGHLEEFRELVELARRCCDAQQHALLNKLSRAYQKPDFCIRRDAVGADARRLLPMTLAWDEDWYYGKEIEL